MTASSEIIERNLDLLYDTLQDHGKSAEDVIMAVRCVCEKQKGLHLQGVYSLGIILMMVAAHTAKIKGKDDAPFVKAIDTAIRLATTQILEEGDEPPPARPGYPGE